MKQNKNRSVGFNAFEQSLMQNPAYLKEVSKIDIAFEVAQMIKEARLLKGYSQQKLAELVGTKQTSISRVENGSYLPSLQFLVKIAKAFQTYLLPPRLGFMYFDGFKKTSFFSTAYRNTVDAGSKVKAVKNGKVIDY